MTLTSPMGKFVNFTATGSIISGSGVLAGIIISNNSSGTLQLADSLTTTTPAITGTITLASTEHWIPMFGVHFVTGLYITVGGSGNFTAVYN